MTNEFLDEAWEEHVWRLAAGLRLVDAVRDGRAVTSVHVAVEDVPRPHPIPRTGPLGVDLGVGLPEAIAPRSGRFAWRYPLPRDRTSIPVRVFARDRRYVPRRLRLPVRALADVVEEDAASRRPPHTPVRRWGFVVALFPGSRYDASGATGVRSRVEDAGGRAIPWARVWATAGSARVEGLAHGDDRGEFVLLLRSTNALLGVEPQLTRDVVLHAALPPATRDSPGDPDLDPLSSLPVETLPSPGQADDVSDGERPPPAYTTAGQTLPVTCRMGRLVGAPPLIVS